MMKLLIPAYIYPSDDPRSAEGVAWASILGHAPDIWGVVVNVANGPGPLAKDSNYTRIIAALRKAGIRVFGYVATDYGRTYAVEQPIADVVRWEELWGIVNIFVDEAASGVDQLPFYATLNCYIKGLSILNHGTEPDPRYLKCGDILCTAETSFTNYTAASFAQWDVVNRARLYHIVLDASLNLASPVLNKARQFADFVYVTDRSYDALPSYFTRLLDKLHSV